MPYFPKYYPPESWWCGRVYVREAERLARILEKHTLKPKDEEHTHKVAFENLYRGIRVLVEKPPSGIGPPNFEDPRLICESIREDLKQFFPAFSELKGNLDLAIKKTKTFFQQYYKISRWNEFVYYFWHDLYEVDQIADILGITEAQAKELQKSFAYSAAQKEKLDDHFEIEVKESIINSHDAYWEMEEYELLSHFGGYGEYRG